MEFTAQTRKYLAVGKNHFWARAHAQGMLGLSSATPWDRDDIQLLLLVWQLDLWQLQCFDHLLPLGPRRFFLSLVKFGDNSSMNSASVLIWHRRVSLFFVTSSVSFDTKVKLGHKVLTLLYFLCMYSWITVGVELHYFLEGRMVG